MPIPESRSSGAIRSERAAEVEQEEVTAYTLIDNRVSYDVLMRVHSKVTELMVSLNVDTNGVCGQTAETMIVTSGSF